MIKLSILIPTIPKRSGLLRRLLTILNAQKTDEVEIITNSDDGRKSIGRKRNELLEAAKGEYVVFIDDDDEVTKDYIPLILQAIKKKPDVVCFNGWMTTNGQQRKDFYFSLNYPYSQVELKGKFVYLRYPNHLCPMRRELVQKIPFDNISLFEDFNWATTIHKQQILKKQVIIPDFIYHYQYRTIK